MTESEAPRSWVLAVAVALGIAAIGAALWMLRSLEFLPVPRAIAPYTPPPIAPQPVSASADAHPRTSAITLVIADGMRLDVATQLPHWAALAQRGAWVQTRALFPTFTRVGFATIFTGMGPQRHGFFSNFNHRAARVPSVLELARAHGVATRLFAPRGRSSLTRQFPHGFDEVLPLAAFAIAPQPRPRLDVVYLPEPDRTSHREGALSEAGRRAALDADGWLGKVAARIDLERETLLATSDHGHIDRGGHGGHEPEVRWVPLLAVGAGISPGRRMPLRTGSDLRDVAPTICTLLGLPQPSWISGRPLYEILREPPPATSRRSRKRESGGFELLGPWARTVSTALAFAMLPFLLLRPRGWRSLRAAVFAIGGFYALYALWGLPWSFSCVNDEAQIPSVMLQILALSALAMTVGAAGSGSVRRFGTWVLPATAAIAGGLWGRVGLGAPHALDFPATTFHAYLALTNLLGAALVCALLLAVGTTRRRHVGRAIGP